MGHRLPVDFIANLTVAGHEFAELARNDDRWNAAMSQAEGSGAVTLAIIQNLLTHPPRPQPDQPNGKPGQGTIYVIANKALTRQQSPVLRERGGETLRAACRRIEMFLRQMPV